MSAENITVFTQNSIRVRTDAGTVYIDPFQMKEEPRDADFILITHDHFDHFSPEDIEKAAQPSAVLVVPEKMAAQAGEKVLRAGLVSRIETVAPGKEYEIASGIEGAADAAALRFGTVPAYNRIKPFHPRSAGWVGYVLLTGGQRIYVAGDTDVTKESQQVRCDVALVPIGGTYTMDAAKAAELINAIRPEIAIPVHYGTVVGKAEDAKRFAEKVDPAIKVEIRL